MSIWSALGGVSSSLINYHTGKALQSNQYRLNLKTLRNAPLASREGFVNAGYNPLLALGSGQAGFSASSSGIGSDLATAFSNDKNSAIAEKQADATVDNLEEQNKKIKAEREGVELDNKLKEKDLNTSPKTIISDLITGQSNPVVDTVKRLGARLGVTNSAVSSNNPKSLRPVIDLSDNKPYVQRGVPRSVVKSFDNLNSAKSVKKFFELSERDLRNYKGSKRRYNRPPREFPQ